MRKTIGEFGKRVMLRLIKIPAQHQRSQLFKLFLQNFNLSNATICLDVGGVTEGFESLSKTCKAIIMNLEVRKMIEGWDLLLGDGRSLPFKDKTIDIIISNALLEHVNKGRNELVQEIKRVSKGNYFVSVPYLYSPFDPHYLLPFFQFVPEPVKRFLLFKVGLKIGWMSKENYDEIRLFKKSQLEELFPEAHIHLLRVFGIPTNLVALKRAHD